MKKKSSLFSRFLLLLISTGLLYLFYTKKGVYAFEEDLGYSVLGLLTVISIVLAPAILSKFKNNQ